MNNGNPALEREIAELLASMKSAEKSARCKSWDPTPFMPAKPVPTSAHEDDVLSREEPSEPWGIDDVLDEFSEWLHIRSGQPLSEVVEAYCDIELPLRG